MCRTEKGLELTRLTLLSQFGVTLVDMLVLPDSPIVDYLTRYSGVLPLTPSANGRTHAHAYSPGSRTAAVGGVCSLCRCLTRRVGITEDKLGHVTATLQDARAAVLKHIDSSSVLVGHSLENDLRALKLAHPRVIDTAICYPHPTPPYKFGLRHLTLEYLHRTIQVLFRCVHISWSRQCFCLVSTAHVRF
jgi:RNA exonuclease 1